MSVKEMAISAILNRRTEAVSKRDDYLQLIKAVNGAARSFRESGWRYGCLLGSALQPIAAVHAFSFPAGIRRDYYVTADGMLVRDTHNASHIAQLLPYDKETDNEEFLDGLSHPLGWQARAFIERYANMYS